jgi:acyl dehydratase
MSVHENTIQAIWDAYGTEAKTSDWFTVEQSDMDKFADCTHDPDWMHIDPARAKREGPFDGTIAFGFWTLSLLSHFQRSTFKADYPPDALYGFNYGLDRVRLLSPVPVGARIRAHTRLLDVREKQPGRVLLKTEVTVEIEGDKTPAMIAEWLFMLVYAD